MPEEMKTAITIAIAAILVVAAIIGHERDPEEKAKLQEHHPPKKR